MHSIRTLNKYFLLVLGTEKPGGGLSITSQTYVIFLHLSRHNSESHFKLGHEISPKSRSSNSNLFNNSRRNNIVKQSKIPCFFSRPSVVIKGVLKLRFTKKKAALISSSFETVVFMRANNFVFLIFFCDASAPFRVMATPYEASRSHSDTPHSIEFLWISDQPDAETYTG